MSRIKFFLFYFLPPILWAILIIIASSIPSKYLPTVEIFGWDKIAHVCVFFIFGILILRWLINFKEDTKDIKIINLVTLIIVITFGIFDEIYQSIIPGRTPDAFDLIADAIGGMFAVLFVKYIKQTILYSLIKSKNK